MPASIAPPRPTTAARPLTWAEACALPTSTLETLVAGERRCQQDEDRWYNSTITNRGARALCRGCPVSVACFELAVRSDVALLAASKKRITANTRLDLVGVRGGARATARRPHVLARLRALGMEVAA